MRSAIKLRSYSDRHSNWITRTGRINPIAIGSTRPGKQSASQVLLPSSPSHALGNQAPFIFGNGSANVEQKLIVRIVAHGPIHELHLAAASFKFFNQQHLVDIVASESVRSSDDDAIKSCSSHLLS